MERHNIKPINPSNTLYQERPFCTKCGEVQVKAGREYCNTCLDNQRKVVSESGMGILFLFLAGSIALYYWLVPPLSKPSYFKISRIWQYIEQLIKPDFASAPIYVLFGCIVLSFILAAYISKKIFDSSY